MGADVANFQYHRSGGRSGAGVIGAIGVVCIRAIVVRGATFGCAAEAVVAEGGGAGAVGVCRAGVGTSRS